MSEALRAMAGPAPPLPPARPRWMRRAAMLRWGWWARLAHLSRRQMAAALGVSESTVKRLRRAVQRELDWQLGEQRQRAGLMQELVARMEAAERGEEQAPLTPEREAEILALVDELAGEANRSEKRQRPRRRPMGA